MNTEVPRNLFKHILWIFFFFNLQFILHSLEDYHFAYRSLRYQDLLMYLTEDWQTVIFFLAYVVSTLWLLQDLFCFCLG